MRTEIVINIANEAIYQLEYYKTLYPAQKKNNEILLIIFTTIIICLIALFVFYCLKFY